MCRSFILVEDDKAARFRYLAWRERCEAGGWGPGACGSNCEKTEAGADRAALIALCAQKKSSCVLRQDDLPSAHLSFPRVVQLAESGRGIGASDRAGEHENRQHVRQHVQKLHRDVLGKVEQLHEVFDCLRETEEDGGPQYAERMPFAEDQCGQGDEALTGNRVVREVAGRRQGDGRAAETGQQAAEQHADIPHFGNADAKRIRRAGMLADGAQAQAERRFKQRVPDDNHENQRNVGGRVGIEQRGADHRNGRQPRNGDFVEDGI